MAMDLRPEDVDALSLEDAADWLDARGISFELLETHGEVLDLIKATLANVDTNTGEKHINIEELMSDAISEDAAMKHDLRSLYIDIKAFARDSLGDELRVHINSIYTDIDARLDENIDDLMHLENAIIVAGETSAGKSSFLNLLIGADVMPCSLLSNTSAICQIHNRNFKQFRVLMENGDSETYDIVGEGSEAEKDLLEKLSRFVGRSNYASSIKINHVDIYWPVPLLNEHVTIVDSPGVGESEEMTEKLVKYLPKAVALIYIVNSANAGGIQEDTILQIILEQKKLADTTELSSFDPKNMLFVCNKWDVVEKRGESEKTWQDTVRKLKMAIHGLPEEHIFKMSVTEAVKYKKSSIGNTEMYQHLLDGLSQFVQDSLVANIKRHYRWIRGLVETIEGYIASRINNANKSSEEKSTFQEKVSLRLSKLEEDSEKVRKQLIDIAQKEFQNVTIQLHSHLQKEDVISFLDTWTEEESPCVTDNDIDVTRFEAKGLIMSRLLHVIQTWESDTRIVERTTQHLSDLFIKEFLIISKNCKDVSKILKYGFLSDGDELVLGKALVREIRA